MTAWENLKKLGGQRPAEHLMGTVTESRAVARRRPAGTVRDSGGGSA